MAMHQFKAESKKLMDMMINSIYTNKEIFLRELISNASDAIDKLYYKSLTDPSVGMNKGDFRILLTRDKDNRLLTVSDNGIGMTKDELAAKYDQWVITSFSPAQVSMERALALYCPEHVVLMPDESGQLCIFRNRYGDALALVRELGVPLSDLPDDVQEEVRPGLGFDDEVTLEKWLESVQS